MLITLCGCLLLRSGLRIDRLSVFCNSIGDEGVNALVDAIISNNSVEVLALHEQHTFFGNARIPWISVDTDKYRKRLSQYPNFTGSVELYVSEINKANHYLP